MSDESTAKHAEALANAPAAPTNKRPMARLCEGCGMGIHSQGEYWIHNETGEEISVRNGFHLAGPTSQK